MANFVDDLKNALDSVVSEEVKVASDTGVSTTQAVTGLVTGAIEGS